MDTLWQKPTQNCSVSICHDGTHFSVCSVHGWSSIEEYSIEQPFQIRNNCYKEGKLE